MEMTSKLLMVAGRLHGGHHYPHLRGAWPEPRTLQAQQILPDKLIRDVDARSPPTDKNLRSVAQNPA